MDNEDQAAQQEIRLVQVHAPIAGPHGPQTEAVFNGWGLYNLRLGPMTRRVVRGEVTVVELTSVGVWFHIKPVDAHLWDGVVATKWGYTSVTFADRIIGVLADLRGRRFPLGDVAIELSMVIMGLPRNQDFRFQLEHGLRNDLSEAELHIVWHAIGPDRLPLDRRVFSEMLEFARLNPDDSTLVDVYQRYADRLDAGRLRYLAEVQAEEQRIARVVAALVRVARDRHRAERGRLSARQRRDRLRLQRHNADDWEFRVLAIGHQVEKQQHFQRILFND